jgi:hypothetical protein
MTIISEPPKGWQEHRVWVDSIFGGHYKTFEGEYLARTMFGGIDPLTRRYYERRSYLYRTNNGYVVRLYDSGKTKLKKVSETVGMRKYSELFREAGIYREKGF